MAASDRNQAGPRPSPRASRGLARRGSALLGVGVALLTTAACSFPEYTYSDEQFYGEGGAAGAGTGGTGGGTGGTGGTGGATGGTGGGTGGSTGGTGGSTGGTGGGTGGTGGSTGGTGGSTGGTGGSTGGTGGTGGTAGAPTCSPPTGSPCDTAPQCNCGAGLTCEVSQPSTGATVCTSVGTTAPYSACTGQGQCTVGHTCVGSCKEYCELGFDCGSNVARVCRSVNWDNAGTPTPVPGMGVCSAGCNPDLSDNVCGPGLTCIPIESTANGYATDCYPAGTGVGANGCPSFSDECARGYACLTNQECRPWCRMGDASACSGAGGCVSLGVVVSGQTYGYCP